ncbi:spermatogenesis associated 6-like protein isoform X2 [Gymnodraco acuticeps]|uniref:Spermatogenesis associated 6-like protein isoform X2 n=1 Tax=Gymnodraco acuticeps TaxID=8218 RepID=A0A6P8W3U6_GYMAC|nr:spermatogenesis associated 6-like protein isoform X2 [Gymnodraco acuticeps]
MSRRALKVLVELEFTAVSCPGVHLPDKDDLCLSMSFMGQARQSEGRPAVFPLLLHQRMTFEKIFRHAVDPGDIAVMLEYETVTIELVQLIPPVDDTLACFEEDARHFLFPEPKLVPSSSGVDREVLMTRAPHFPGIAPRLEFSTKTTIIECLVDAEMIIYPNITMRPLMKRNRKHCSRPRSCSPQRRQPPALGSRRGVRASREITSRSPPFLLRTQSLPPHSQHLARLRLDSAPPAYAVFVSWSQWICPALPLCNVYQLLFTFDQVFIHWLEGYHKMTPALQKHKTHLTTTRVRTLPECGGLTGNKPGTAGPFLLLH